jgi:hypothetical protein
MFQACGNPDLTPAKAGEIITRTPEFNGSRTLLAVKSTTRGAGSLDLCCYTAEFTFRETTATSKPAAIDAKAEFRYWEGGWHLQDFWYGRLPDITTVDIQSDPPKSQ